MVLKDKSNGCARCAESLVRANKRAPSCNAKMGRVCTTDVGCARYSGMSYATYWVGLMEVSKHVTQAA